MKRLSLSLLALAGSLTAGPLLYIADGANLGTVDIDTGAVTVIGSTGLDSMTDIAFDSSGQLWGVSFGSLYRIDKNTGASTLIGATGTNLNSLVFGSDGTLYGAWQSLFTINTTTGAATSVGSLGGGHHSAGDLAFDDGTLYLTTVAGNLVSVNTVTGAATTVGPLGFGNMYGLANGGSLFGVAGTNVYSVNPATGGTTFLVGYGGQGLGAPGGSAFLAEATATPEPSTLLSMAGGLAVAAWFRRKRA